MTDPTVSSTTALHIALEDLMQDVNTLLKETPAEERTVEIEDYLADEDSVGGTPDREVEMDPEESVAREQRALERNKRQQKKALLRVHTEETLATVPNRRPEQTGRIEDMIQIDGTAAPGSLGLQLDWASPNSFYATINGEKLNFQSLQAFAVYVSAQVDTGRDDVEFVYKQLELLRNLSGRNLNDAVRNLGLRLDWTKEIAETIGHGAWLMICSNPSLAMALLETDAGFAFYRRDRDTGQVVFQNTHAWRQEIYVRIRDTLRLRKTALEAGTDQRAVAHILPDFSDIHRYRATPRPYVKRDDQSNRNNIDLRKAKTYRR
jgi:hypothetical protein